MCACMFTMPQVGLHLSASWHRNMITDCGNVTSVPIGEPAAEVALLLNCMYSYEQPVSAEQLPTILRLADKCVMVIRA